MTKEEFTTYYARNSKLSVETLAALGFEAERCTCGESGCRGWKMTLSTKAGAL